MNEKILKLQVDIVAVEILEKGLKMFFKLLIQTERDVRLHDLEVNTSCFLCTFFVITEIQESRLASQPLQVLS